MTSDSNNDGYETLGPSFQIDESSLCIDVNPQSTLSLRDNSLLLINSQGQIFCTQYGSTKLLADFGSSVKLAYCNGCIVLVSSYGVAFRYILNNHVPLRELSYLPVDDNQCFIEISNEEAYIWSAQSNDDCFSVISRFAQKCRERVGENMNDEEYLVVEVDDIRGMVKDLTEFVKHYTKVQNSDPTLLSYGALLLDKLRFHLNPYAPYNSSNPPRFSEEWADAEDLAHHSVMNSEAARRLSFYKWQRTDCLYATPKSLAAAGFFHRPTLKSLDRVACFTCTVCLVNWEVQDDPMQEHVKHGSNCRFMNKGDHQNIPYESTLSHLPLYRWTTIYEKPDLQLNANNLILSYMTPETSWFAVAVPPAPNSHQNKTSIFLFNTSKVAVKPIEILLDLYATCMVDKMGLLSSQQSSNERKQSFEWLSSVDSSPAETCPLCVVRAMCTVTNFDECTVTIHGEQIVGALCTGVAVDENQLKAMGREANLLNPTVVKTPVKRRPFILVHHIVDFPNDDHVLAVNFANTWSQAWTSTSTQNPSRSSYPSVWANDENLTSDSPVDAVVLCDDGKSDSYAEITKETSKDQTSEIYYNPMNSGSDKPPDPDHVPIYYDDKKTVAIGIQCIRLPSEFDSSDYQIDCLVSSPNGNVVVAAVNRRESKEEVVSCAILVYTWVPMVHLLKEVPVSVISFRNGCAIEAVHVLGKDYFTKTNDKDSKPLSTELLNDTVCVLFNDGSLSIVDLDFGYSKKVEVARLKHLNMTVTGELCGLTMDNKLVNIAIQPSIPHLNQDATEEQVISLLSALEKIPPQPSAEGLNESLRYLISKTSFDFSSVESVLTARASSLSIEQLASIWSLIRAEPLVRNHHLVSTSETAVRSTTSVPASRSKSCASQQAQLQSTLGLIVQTPREFVEFSLQNRDRSASNPTILATTTCQQFCVLNKMPYSDLLGFSIDATRTWQVRSKRESTKKSFVFEMALTFGLNLSHINLTLGLSGFVRGVSDIRVTIYVPRRPNRSFVEEACELFSDVNQSTLADANGDPLMENYLELLGRKSHALDHKFHRCLGPFDIREFVDANSKQATIQLSIVQLLFAAANAQSKVAPDEINFEEGWMRHTQRFLVLVEVNERRTAQQKAFQLAMQSAQNDSQRRELFQSIGGSKRGRMEASTGGVVPLPHKAAAERKKQQVKCRGTSCRKRFVHVPNLVAETVTMSALKPYTSGENKSDTILSCFEYLTISAYKTTDLRKRSNMERCLLYADTKVHFEILKMASGIVSNTEIPYYRLLVAQQHALDLLGWLLTQWRITRDKKKIHALGSKLREIVPTLIQNCFVVAPRTISRKMSAMLTELLDLTYQKDTKLIAVFLKSIAKTFATKRFRFSASLQWLTMLVRVVVRNVCLRRGSFALSSEELVQLVAQLNKACTQLVQNTGKVWRSRRSASNMLLRTGDLFADMELLEETKLYYTPSMLAILFLDPNLIANARNNARLAFSTFKNATSNLSANGNEKDTQAKGSSAASTRPLFETTIHFDSSVALSQIPPQHQSLCSKQLAANNNGVTEQAKDANWLSDATALATIQFLDDADETDLRWFEYLGINSLDNPIYPTKKATNERSNNALNTSSQIQTVIIPVSSPALQSVTPDDTQNPAISDLLLTRQVQAYFDDLRQRYGNQNVHRFLIGADQMPGLNEVERLYFKIISSTCQMRVIDLNAPMSGEIAARSSPTNSEKNVNLPQIFFGFPSRSSPFGLGDNILSGSSKKKPAFVPAQSKNLQSGSSIESRDSQLKSAAEAYLLERHCEIFERTTSPTERHSLPLPTTSSFVAFAPNEENNQLYHGDKFTSALISYDEGDGEDRLFPTDDSFCNQLGDNDTPMFSCRMNKKAEKTRKKFLCEEMPLLPRRPSNFVIELESCQSGQLVQLVLDFHACFMLTDLIVPANELFSAVAVDGWLHDEKHSSTRFAYSTEIENRSLVLNDVISSAFIRYVRVSFTVRDCRRSRVSFMVGHFYGTKYCSPWQMYSMPEAYVETEDGSDPCGNFLRYAMDNHGANAQKLETLATHLCTRFQSNFDQLRQLSKQACAGTSGRQLYRKCLLDRRLYNNMRAVIDRSQFDMQPASLVLSNTTTSLTKDWFECQRQTDLRCSDSWWDASLNELRFASIEFMSLANDIHNFLLFSQQNISKAAIDAGLLREVNSSSYLDVVDLETAVRLFGCFVSDVDSRLQAVCCSFLFHQGSRSSWWPDFFPAVIRRHFVSGSSDSLENIFILLAYICDQSVRHHELHTPIIEKLLFYMQELIKTPKTINGSVDTTQLSWLLLLLSTAFDIIVPGTKNIDRWSFVSGQSCTNYSQVAATSENFRRYTRKAGTTGMKDQVWMSHYQNVHNLGINSTNLSNSHQFGQPDDAVASPYTMSSYQKYPSTANFWSSTLDHAQAVEMKKLGNEIRSIGKQLDTMLPNNQLNSDDFTPLKKEQKTLLSLFNSSQAYLHKTTICIQDNFLDKVLIGGLEKSELESKKAPLATQEDEFAVNLDENASDSAVKKQQLLEASNATVIRNRLAKARRTLYLLIKQAKNTQASRGKAGNAPTIRSRRFAVRLHLPQQTVIQTIRVLLRLMYENSSILSSPTQIVLFKVCAKLGVHGCRNPLSFRQLMESVQMTQNLLAVVIENSTYNEWVLHALTAFILDVCEAENPAAQVNEPSASSTMDFSMLDDQGLPLGRHGSDASKLASTQKDTNGNMEDAAAEETQTNSDESKKKRRKEVSNEMETEQSKSEPSEKDQSPMEEENSCLASTSTLVANVDDEDTLGEAKSKFNSLSIVSQTLITSGLVNEYAFVANIDPNSMREERELHLGLMDERSEIGETPRYPFTFTLFDKPNEADVDLLILMALFAIKPIEKKNPTYWETYRSSFLRLIGYSVARARYDRGEPLSEIFRWFDYVMGAEVEAANNCSSEGAYVKWGVLSLIHSKDFIEREFDLSGKLSQNEKSPSHSALTCALYFSHFYYIHDSSYNTEIEEEPSADSLGEKFNNLFGKLLQSANGRNSEIESFKDELHSIIERRRELKNDSDLPEKQSKLNTACIEAEDTCSGMDTSEDSIHLMAIRGFMPLFKTVFTFTKLRFIQSVLNVRRCVLNLSYSNLPEVVELQPTKSSKQTAEKSKRRKSMTKSRHLDHFADHSLAEKTRSFDALLDDHMQYNVTMSANFLNSRACPLNLVANPSSTLDVRIFNAQRRLMAEHLASDCISLHKMAPAVQRTVKTSTVYDSRALPGMDMGASLVVEAVNHLLSELDVHKANEMSARTHRFGGGQFLLNLVNFYWNFQANRSLTSDSINLSRHFVLSEKAITNLMYFAVEYSQMNEQIWLHLFKILNALDALVEDAMKDSKSYKFTQWVENSPYFVRFMDRFFNSSMGRFNLVSSTRNSYGPVVQNAFSRFALILFKQITSRTMDSLLMVITKAIRNSRECGYVNFPLEMIYELTTNFDRMDRVCQCTPSVFAEFILALMDLTSDFFVEIQRIHRHYKEESLRQEYHIFSSESLPVLNNVCFSGVLTAASMLDRNARMNDRLRVYNSGSTTKNTKNIALIKRADLLENSIRDNDVSTRDMFTGIQYSLLRLCVRFVSQYKPHILKVILQEQPKSLSRAIDMLFMFVSSTTKIEDITVENFKIITLSDAVIHLLLVISETSMEDPESCRLFIRFVIKVLRDRVSSVEEQQPTTSSKSGVGTPTQKALMDLPLPVLLLIKSLLRGVSRCQIFIDEGGHSFVAEQLQRSLDAVVHDWPAHTHFSNISRQLNALASSITGIEPINPLASLISLQSAPAETANTSNSQRATQTNVANTSANSNSYAPTSSNGSSSAQNQLCMKYPSVAIQASTLANPNQAFGPNNPVVSMQLVNVKSTNLQPVENNKNEDLHNFAPITSLISENVSPSHLTTLIQNFDANKRNRAPTFSYRFPAKKYWFDVTMILPYKIVLEEIVIRGFDQSGLVNAPSAIQVELSSDSAQASWFVLSCPVVADNPLHYRISTHSYRLPVTGVRIHFGCPVASTLLYLTQVQLLGSTSIQSMKFLTCSTMFESQVIFHWVSLFSRLCKRIDVPIWNYAPKLAESLIKVYLGEEHQKDFRQVYELLAYLDAKSKTAHSLVTTIVNYLVNGGRICPKAYSSIAELLYATCISGRLTPGFSHRVVTESRSAGQLNEIVILRQRELLTGIQRLLKELVLDEMYENNNWVRPEAVREIAVFVWAAACVIWHNASDKVTRYDTIALCLEIGPLIIPTLTKFVLNIRDTTLHQASCWLLCTLARTSPEHLSQMSDCLGLNSCSYEVYSIPVIRVLSKACQSTAAAEHLINKGVLASWSTLVIQITGEKQRIQNDQLLAVINCFRELSVIDCVAKYFDKPESELLFHSLIEYVMSYCKETQVNRTTSAEQSTLLRAVIGFIQHCLTSRDQRERVARIIAQFLKNYTTNQKGLSLPKPLQELVLSLIIEDEKIVIRLTGVTTSQTYCKLSFEEQMLHPLFGCMQEDQVMEVPLGTFCKELLPYTRKNPQLSVGKSTKCAEAIPFPSNFKWLFSTDETDEKEVALSKENHTETPLKVATDYPYLYKQFAIQLVCDELSVKHALNNCWPLERVFNELRSAMSSKCLGADSSASVDSQIQNVRSPDSFNDGYFTLTLRVKASLQTSMLPLVEESPNYTLLLQNAMLLPSTLLCFARCDGLKYLSRAVDVMTRMDEKLRIISKMVKHLSTGHPANIKYEVFLARKAMRETMMQTDRKTSNVDIDTDSYQLLFDATDRPTQIMKSVLEDLSKNGFQITETELGQQAVTQQPKTNAFSTAFTATDYFDTIDGIAATAVDDEMVSVFDFMTEATSSSSPKFVPKHTGTKHYAPVSAQTLGLISAVAEEDWTTLADVPSSSVVPLNLQTVPGNFDPMSLEFYGQITTQLQSQLSDIASKIQTGSANSKDGTYVVKVPIGIPLRRPRSAKSPSNRQSEFFEHLMIALSLFFEVETYGPTFVEYDIRSAKYLIYLLLGMEPPSFSTEVYTHGLTPVLSQSQFGSYDACLSDSKESQTNNELLRRITAQFTDSYGVGNQPGVPAIKGVEFDTDDLVLIPFAVLSRCFENAAVFKVGAAEAERIRLQALKNGTIDVVLTLLSHYSNQQPLMKHIRASGDLVVTKLINNLICYGNHISTIIGMFNESHRKQRSKNPKLQVPAKPLSSSASSGTKAPNPGSATLTFGAQIASVKTDYWAKGTGFGSGTTSSQFNLANHLSQQKQNEVVVTCLLNVLTNFIKPQSISSTYQQELESLDIDRECMREILSAEASPLPTAPTEFVEIVERSCLCRNLSTFLMNDSVLDISNHASAYEAIIGLLLAIYSCSSTVQVNKKETVHLSERLITSNIETAGSTVYERLKQLCACIDVYISKLGKSNEPSTSEFTIKQQEEELIELLKNGNLVVNLMEKQNKTKNQIDNEDEHMDEQRQYEITPDYQGYITGRPLELVYLEVLKPLQYQTVNFFNADGTLTAFPYHYATNMTTMSQVASGKRIRRLAQESASLLNSLPLSLSSSVFVCVAEERLDTMKVLLTGPADTPYSGGCFEFDVYFPNDYPQVPMQMNLQTTGNHTVRFNPNLYDDGKVCLSILNTWSGRPEERWNAQTSSFLQVLVSIQSLILVPEPFFNEPGFERTRGTLSGDQSSRDYSANIRHQTIRWAMIEQLRKPSLPFVEIIRRHFWLKRDEICLQVQEWIRETKELIEKNPMAKQLSSHLTVMEKNFENLLLEFNKLECPSPELEFCRSKFLHDYSENQKSKDGF